MLKKSQKRFIIVISALITLSLASCLKDIQTPSLPTDPAKTIHSLNTSLSKKQDYEQNELLVKFKPGYTEAKKGIILARVGGNIPEKIYTKTLERAGDMVGTLMGLIIPSMMVAKRAIRMPNEHTFQEQLEH